MRVRMVMYLTVMAVVSGACGGGKDGPTTPTNTVREIDVVNYLASTAAVSFGGTPFGSVGAAATTSGTAVAFAVPTNVHTLSYTLAKKQRSDGSAIPDDLDGETNIAIPDGAHTLLITNVVGAQAYISIQFGNTTAQTVALGVFSNGQLKCVGSVPGNTAPPFTGYYALTSGTEVRYYRGAACGGAYLFWNSTQLANYQANTGVVSLLATSLP